MKNAIKTKHNLDFEACPWPRDPSITAWRVGTCHGQNEKRNESFMIIVELLKDDPRFKIKKGDQFEAIVYNLDPMKKVALLRRLSDGFEPKCNEYRHNVKVIRRK